MKPIRHLIILALALVTSLASAQEPSLREQFKTAVDNYQAGITNGNTMANTKVMLKVIELYKQLEPPPAVPEEAREPFVMGATVLKESKDATTAGKAVELFGNAIWLAPWWAEARYNHAVACEASGLFDVAIFDLNIYLAFKLTDDEHRQAQDKIYALKAKAELAATRKLAAEQKAKIELEDSPQAKAASQLEKDKALIRSLDGVKFTSETHNGDVVWRNIYEIHGQEAHFYIEVIANNSGSSFQVRDKHPWMRRPGDNDKPPLIWSQILPGHLLGWS